MKNKAIQAPLSGVKAILGLGNPGKEFENTYHNVGATFIDGLARREGIRSMRRHRSGLLSYARKDGVYIIHSLTFMNESGRAARAAQAFLKLKPEELLVVHDDSDIALGDYKLSFGRGSAGHKGVQSIIHALHTDCFSRARIGIRKNSGKAGDFVLRKIGVNDRKKIQSVFSEFTEKLIENESL